MSMFVRLCGASRPSSTGNGNWSMDSPDAPIHTAHLWAVRRSARDKRQLFLAGLRTRQRQSVWLLPAIRDRPPPIAFLGTLPFLYLSDKHFSLGTLVVTVFVRGTGMSAVGIPSISAAYASVRNEELPMATTSLNIVQRLGGRH
jgi:hypothetical protein